ncbi:hypothetical protein BDDG_04674 [Blastomyces dermatitidis ATCC 18188]|uniref:Uncharacterized protein n=1 Tax=Ajellomyces dermatitidis (strain ATCC 18188 / CBS 674.68) TaxID=653446 RepID=F2TEU6_AJEDA|nr:hypothetical protein BDDG_04674 [Blastomyces dermatitidis ATCC 18188]
MSRNICVTAVDGPYWPSHHRTASHRRQFQKQFDSAGFRFILMPAVAKNWKRTGKAGCENHSAHARKGAEAN